MPFIIGSDTTIKRIITIGPSSPTQFLECLLGIFSLPCLSLNIFTRPFTHMFKRRNKISRKITIVTLVMDNKTVISISRKKQITPTL